MNPHDCNNHKILSLARLPVPTLPHIFDFLSLVSRDFDIISNEIKYVNTYFYFLHIFYEPQLSFYSGNEFKRTKRFGHIIIRSQGQPCNFIRFLVLRCQHDNGVCVFFPDFLAEGKSAISCSSSTTRSFSFILFSPFFLYLSIKYNKFRIRTHKEFSKNILKFS